MIEPTTDAAICVPTLNAGDSWNQWLSQAKGTIERLPTLVIDSSSDDDTARLAEQAGCQVRVIERRHFDHGATRDWALRTLHDCEIVVFLTQDALPATPDAIDRLVEVFRDPAVGAAYGRQLPHVDATPLAAHARLFNYPPRSHRVTPADMKQRGIKAAFLSNSFAAYRRRALLEAGGFPHDTILGEDMVAGARLLKAGWQLAYCAEACVHHSHNYSWGQEFRRYFDIGVMHSREAWILVMTGRAEGEGRRFVVSELRYLARRTPWAIPGALVRNALKYLGYRLGRGERRLPLPLKRRLSMHRGYWRPRRATRGGG
ncbi:MAG: rhamnosyltransferase [Halomonadaceae bacterium T82-2]|nr:MAG: rhamnosyltransferase [Halomonadaceae bacterium T82-2]